MEDTTIEAQGIAKPDLQLFKNTLTDVSADASTVLQRRRMAVETRYCLWAGQAPDGRKHKAYNGNKEVFPFEGGSDHRVRLADTIINENVRLGMGALRGAQLQIEGTEITDVAEAGRTQAVFSWLRRANKREIEDAFRLYLNYREGDGPGLGVMGVFWQREWAMEAKELTLEELVLMFLGIGGIQEPNEADFARAQDLFINPTTDAEAVELLANVFQLRTAEARAALRTLRRGDPAEINTPYMAKNGLCLKPLRLWEDIFFPANTTDIQKAQCIFLRELVTESELRTRAKSNDWPKEFVDGVLEHRGQSWLNFDTWADHTTGSSTTYSGRGMTDQNKDKFEIITGYTRAYDPKSKHGLSGVYRTVFHGSVDTVAEHKPNGYWHGQYPFVVGTQERITKNLMDSRGVGEIVLTDQLVKKSQVDLTIDASTLTAIPSIKMRTKRKDMNLKIGPLSKHYLDRGEDWEYAKGPQHDPRSQTILDRVDLDVDMYWGRVGKNVDPNYAMDVRQDRADRFLGEAESIFQMGMSLAEQFLTPEEAERIAPGWQVPFGAGGAEATRKRYDTYLSFDVKSLDPEFIAAKLKAFNEFLMPLDKYGIIDGATLVADAAQLIDPMMGDRYIKSAESASQSEVDETMADLQSILAGIQPSMPERGINHKLRYQTLSQTVRTNPQIQGTLRENPISMQLFNDYMAFLKQQIVQEHNKTTGKKGVAPSFGGDANQATGVIQSDALLT